MNRFSSSSADWKDNDFNWIVESLTSNMYEATKALYDLENTTSTVNIWNFWHNYRCYREVRESLSSQWQAVVPLMQSCDYYGGRIIRLREKKELDQPTAIEFLETISGKGDEMVKMAEQLNKNYHSNLAIFRRYRNRLTSSIPPSRPKPTLRDVVGAFQQWSRMLWDAYVLRSNTQTDPVPHHVKATVEPDGEKAMLIFEKCNKDIYQLLESLMRFLTTQTTYCDRYLEQCRNQSIEATATEITDFVEHWDRYRIASRQATKDIDKVCDAVIIHVNRRGGALRKSERDDGS